MDREALDAFYIRGHSLDRDRRDARRALGHRQAPAAHARKRLKVELETSVADPGEWTDSSNCRDDEDELELVGTGASETSAW